MTIIDLPPAPPKKWNIFAEAFRSVWLFFFHLSGWRIVGELPATKKIILIGAPHTSNWDMMLFLSAVMHYRVRIRWMGKHVLFEGPWAWSMRFIGGIPVDRRKSNNAVDQTIEFLNTQDEIVLAIAPEGTRSHTEKLKSGFYHIAHGAKMPIVVAFIDSKTKTAGVSFSIETTGDYESDIAPVRELFSSVQGIKPEKSGLYKK